MSTIPNQEVMQNRQLNEFSDRIAKARGPVQYNQLYNEISAAPLAEGCKTLLHEMVAARIGQEREMMEEMTNSSKLKLALA